MRPLIYNDGTGDGLRVHGMYQPLRISAKRRRNRKRICYCFGYHFPHRIGSRASEEYARTHGTAGCEHAGDWGSIGEPS